VPERRKRKTARQRGGASYPCTCKKKAVTRVLDTRRRADVVIRRRKCVDCGRVFETHEKREP